MPARIRIDQSDQINPQAEDPLFVFDRLSLFRARTHSTQWQSAWVQSKGFWQEAWVVACNAATGAIIGGTDLKTSEPGPLSFTSQH